MIDLTQPLPSPPESASVQAARQAQMLPLPEPSRAAQPTFLTQSVPEGTPSLQVPISPLPPPESRPPAAEVPPPTTIVHGFARKKSSRWPIILVFSATIVLVLVITGGIALWILQRGPEVAGEWNGGSNGTPSSSNSTTEQTQQASTGHTPAVSSGNRLAKLPEESQQETPSSGTHTSASQSSENTENATKTDPSLQADSNASPSNPKTPGEDQKPEKADETPESPASSGLTPPEDNPPKPQPPEKPPQPQEKPPQRLWISIPNASSDGGVKDDHLFSEDIQLELIPEKLELKEKSISFNWQKKEDQKQKWSIGRSTRPGGPTPVAYFIVEKEKGKLHFEWESEESLKYRQEYFKYLGDALLLVKRGNTLLGYVQLRACPKVFPIKLGNGEVPPLGNIQTKVSPQNLKIFVQLRNEKEKSVIAEAKPLPWNLSIPHPETGCELRITIELNGDALLCKQFTFIDKIAPPPASETLEKKDIKETLDYIEQRKQQLNEEIKKLSEAPQDKEKKENLDKNIKDRKDSIQKYQKVATWLESLSQSEIHYAIYHEVEKKDSQEKSHRVYVAVSDESMLSEESPPEKK